MMKDDLIDQVQARMSDAEFKATLLTLLQKSRIIRESIQDIQHYRTQAAVKMMSAGMPRNEIAHALQKRFGLSRSRSYVYIKQAIEEKRLMDERESKINKMIEEINGR